MAAVAAVAILVTVVLPAEYGIDPTRVGRLLGLTEMGEIKTQLFEEAEADRRAAGEQSSILDAVFGIFIGTAHPQGTPAWRDEITFTLEPGEAPGWKMVMEKGQTTQYRVTVEGGRVNFDLHSHGSGESVTYERARGSTGSEGAIIADFAGEHGWFLRNRDNADVTVTIQVRGEYAEFKNAN